MRGFVRAICLSAAAIIVLTGCNRHDANNAEFEMGAASAESDYQGYLGLKIVKVYEKQKALDQSPWHTDGGDWVFLDCQGTKDPSVNILVGSRIRSSERSNDGSPLPISWGEARLVMDNPEAAGRFIDAFAKAFHTQSPPVRANNPVGILKMQTAVLGTSLVPAKGGGFTEGNGTWTATKWFVQDEPVEAEVLFDFSLSEKRAEFSEKDPDYREDLVQQFAVALRDGPLPERTPENDPTLTLVGPTVVNWTLIGSSNEMCQFSPDGATLAFTAGTLRSASKIFIAPATAPTQRKLMGEFEGNASIGQFVPTPNGLCLFVIEAFHKDPHMISTADPQKYWLLDGKGKHAVNLPAAGTNWIAWKDCVSPDGNFIVFDSWENGPGKQRSRVLQIGNLRSGQWQTAKLPGTVLELVGWDGDRGIVLTGLDFDKRTVRKPYSLDVSTAQLSPLDAIPAQFNPALQLSPNKKQSIEVIEKDRVIITDLGTGQKREFVFQQADKPAAYRDSVRWGNDRYLVFSGERTAFIDSQTLKMSFLAGKTADFNTAEFSGDFKSAIGMKDGSHYLGKVKLPE